MQEYLSLVRHKGNLDLFMALELSFLSLARKRPLHLHVEGLRGTGKTSIIRSLKGVLPKIERIKGCLHNCDPQKPHCPLHKDREMVWDTEWIPMPFLEISHSAKVGTVVGTIDLEKLTNERPETALLPGTIAQAHRGIIFIDEINRLADTAPDLTDVLLDVMGTKPGRLQIEEAGLPMVTVSVEVTVLAASNPDEEPGPLAEIRRQLADRFDFHVLMSRPDRVEDVLAVLKRLSKRVEESIFLLDLEKLDYEVVLEEDVLRELADLYVQFNLESLRGLEAWRDAISVWMVRERLLGRELAGAIAAVAPLILQHRLDQRTFNRLMSRLTSKDKDEPPKGTGGESISEWTTVHTPQTVPLAKAEEASSWWHRFLNPLSWVREVRASKMKAKPLRQLPESAHLWWQREWLS